MTCQITFRTKKANYIAPTTNQPAAMFKFQTRMGLLNWIIKEERQTKVITKDVFVCFAQKDVGYKNYLIRQAGKDNLPMKFDDMSAGTHLSEENWKALCQKKIEACDGAIVLLSIHTPNAKDAKWELKCIKELNVPVIAMHIQKENKGLIPMELKGKRVMDWNWDQIERFVESL